LDERAEARQAEAGATKRVWSRTRAPFVGEEYPEFGSDGNEVAEGRKPCGTAAHCVRMSTSAAANAIFVVK